MGENLKDEENMFQEKKQKIQGRKGKKFSAA